MIAGRAVNKIINIFTGIFGMTTLILILLSYLNSALGGIILHGDAPQTVEHLKNYMTLATVFCAGAEFTLKRNIILAAVFALIVVGTAVVMLYTDFAM